MNGTPNWCTLVDVHPEGQTAVGRRAHPAFPPRPRGFPVRPLPCLTLSQPTSPDARLGAVSPLVAPCAFFFLCLAADGGVGGAGPNLAAPGLGSSNLSLARTLQPRPGDRARHSGVSWAAGLGRGRPSRNRIPAPFRTWCGSRRVLGFSACPDGLRSPSKTFMVLRVIL